MAYSVNIYYSICLHFFTDINECFTEKDICGNNALCENTIGSFNCSCLKGYLQDVQMKCCKSSELCLIFLAKNCNDYDVASSL